MDKGNKQKRKAKWAGLNFAGTTDWAHCRSPGATDMAQDSKERWDLLCSSEAWNAAMDNYRNKKASDKQGFSRITSNFFHGPPSMDCDVLAGENDCHNFQSCIQGDIQTFAPEPKASLALKNILDIVSFGLTAATGPFFNNSLVSFSSFLFRRKPKAASDASMSDQLAVIVHHYKTAFTEVSSQAFGGSDKAIEMVQRTIGNGKLLDAKPAGKLDLEDRIIETHLSPSQRCKKCKPVLIDTQSSCSGGAGDADGLLLLDEKKSKVCVGGKRYCLVRPEGKAFECPSERSQQLGMACHYNKKNPSDEGQWPDLTNSESFDRLWKWTNNDNMVQSPGLVDIPMCGWAEFKNNWSSTKNNYCSWPCNKP
ncbi:hypothetical protein B0T22DRAFT_479931 [Podospora appendiculata]|uniref:Uncharacterized protein n=1 Tax=Podospora appendiculata TaxID=314037 RepID=A0AAE1CCJ5_9PEZI|nr:hypothetical protein B0T22DRAFT_479931 [Podospora appendiculata]